MIKSVCYYLVAGLFLLLVSSSGHALNAQREMFKAAEKAIQLQDQLLFNTLKSSLQNYPLYPYLLYSDLIKRLDDNPAEEVRNFLNVYKNSPLAVKLHNTWVSRLAKQQRWNEVLQNFQNYGRTETECYYRQALLQTNQSKQALHDIEVLWLVGKSQPDACDPIFKHWQESVGFTQELIWRRFLLAMEAGNAGLGRYLSRLLAEPAKTTADLWLAVHEKPQRVLESHRFSSNQSHTSSILLHGIWRWSRNDSVAAARALDQLKQRYDFVLSERLYRLERRLAILIAKRKHPSAAARLAALSPQSIDEEVEEWSIRVALQQQNWRLVLQWLERLRPQSQKALAWRYWRARALEANGNSEAAKVIYQELAKIRDYYGFLAADRIGSKYHIKHHPIQVSEQSLLTLSRLPGFQRAHELYILQRLTEAREEWNFISRDFDAEQFKTVAQMAHHWGWHAQAIAMLARADLWDDLELRFPMPYRQQINNYARSNNIDPAWVYAVMRRESLFQPDARSSAGALGLMQIMPATGRKIASDLNAPRPSKRTLMNIDTNIRFGAYYLRYTLNQLQGNVVLATAAYNAGPGRIRDWLPKRNIMPADIWVELIPFNETRKYVKRVMEYSAVYEWKLGRPQSSMSKRMARILPGV